VSRRQSEGVFPPGRSSLFCFFLFTSISFHLYNDGMSHQVKNSPDIPPQWLAEFEAAARRLLATRFKYAFIKTYKPVMDDARYQYQGPGVVPAVAVVPRVLVVEQAE
jgi:hypothetical protein